MSKVTTVSVNYGVTKNTGIKFEFVRIDMTAEATVEEGEDPQIVRRKLLVDLKKDVDDATDRVLLSLTQ